MNNQSNTTTSRFQMNHKNIMESGKNDKTLGQMIE
jgi:hypothetical protein